MNTKQPERIDLPHGYFVEPFFHEGEHVGYDLCSPDGTLVFGKDDMGIPQAKAFAAAMRPVEASPLPGDEHWAQKAWDAIDNARDGHKTSALMDVLAAHREQATAPLREALELLNIIDHGDGRVWIMTRVHHKNKVGAGSVMVEGELAEAFRNLKRKQEAALAAHPTKAESLEVPPEFTIIPTEAKLAQRNTFAVLCKPTGQTCKTCGILYTTAHGGPPTPCCDCAKGQQLGEGE